MSLRLAFVFSISNHDLEPVGVKAPSFPSSAKSSTYVYDEGQSFTFLCQAQALPIPIFR